MKRIVILISDRGSNMQAIVNACAQQAWPAKVVAVLSHRPEARGLAHAQERGIATSVVDHRSFGERAAFDAAMAEAIDAHAPDVVALAGFMRVLGPVFVRHYAGRLLNVHPSLLPAFAGLHSHRRALAAGCKVAGATVHFVDDAVDGGAIVVQAVVPVLPDDDEAALAERVLAREHVIYPLALRWFVEGALSWERGVVRQAQGRPQLL